MGIDQYDLKHLFDRLDDALGLGRKSDDPNRLRANSFMLIGLDDEGIATFKHLEAGTIVRFDYRKKRIVA